MLPPLRAPVYSYSWCCWSQAPSALSGTTWPWLPELCLWQPETRGTAETLAHRTNSGASRHAVVPASQLPVPYLHFPVTVCPKGPCPNDTAATFRQRTVRTNLKGTQNYKVISLQSFLFLSMLGVSHIHLQERRETKRISPEFWGTAMLLMGFPGGASGKEPACQCRRYKKMWVWSLDGEDPLEEHMASHSSILAWRVPWTEEPGGDSPQHRKESDMTEATEWTSKWRYLCF